jgi:predicted nucleic acid-binding protein
VSGTPEAFLDTNVLVYAFSSDDRTVVAEKLLGDGCTISVQTLNEFVNVSRRKLSRDWAEIEEAVAIIRRLCARILPVDVATHETALGLASRYGFSFFDALMLASALQGGCTTFWSEDLQHGQKIDDRLTVRNPFR